MIKRFVQFNESIKFNEFKEYFLSLINGSEIKWIDNKYIYWLKDDKWLIYYKMNRNIFYYNHSTIFLKLESKFGYNYVDIDELLIPILKERFNCLVSDTMKIDTDEKLF